MGFLDRVGIKAENIKVAIDDIYRADAQYHHFVESVLSLLHKFSVKFKLNEEKMLEMFTKHLKREL